VFLSIIDLFLCSEIHLIKCSHHLDTEPSALTRKEGDDKCMKMAKLNESTFAEVHKDYVVVVQKGLTSASAVERIQLSFTEVKKLYMASLDLV